MRGIMIEKTYSFEKNGKINEVYTLSNSRGSEVDVLTYGARLIRVSMPDNKGKFGDCLVGFKRPEWYYEENPYFGATVGRYANRIGGAAFSLNGEKYELEDNENGNTLHGGVTAAFDRVVWDAKIVNNRLVLSHFSPDGAGGFPGNLSVTLVVSLSEDNEITLDYEATTDKDTVCSFTNHAYFNIGIQPTVLNHILMLSANKITEVDKRLIPNGKFIDIENTPYSFMRPKKIGEDIFLDAPLLRQCSGYDFNYCIDRLGKGLEHFGYVYDPETGRRMDCYTTLPCVQLYTANKLGKFQGKSKKRYYDYGAICLEAQNYPDAPNQPAFPSALLKAGEKYHEITSYRFSVK